VDKAELLDALSGLMDETDIRVCDALDLKVFEIRRVAYVPSERDRPAYIALVIDSQSSGEAKP
jgi:hypothetical protein